ARAKLETPRAADAATVERLHARAEGQGVLLCPVHQFLFQPGILQAAQWLSSLGTVRPFEMVSCSAGADPRGDPEQVARDILPHGLALARRLLGAQWLDAGWYTAPGEAGVGRASPSRVPTTT